MAEIMTTGQAGQPTRRHVLKICGALATGCAIPPVAAATPADMQAAVAKIIGGAPLNVGKVRLEIPPLVENGNTVPCAVSVDSPMTATEHVKAIHILTEKNPQPNVMSVALGPRAGRASISTRIRLRGTQDVLAIAEMSDGSFWSDRVRVLVTVSACLEEVL